MYLYKIAGYTGYKVTPSISRLFADCQGFNVTSVFATKLQVTDLLPLFLSASLILSSISSYLSSYLSSYFSFSLLSFGFFYIPISLELKREKTGTYKRKRINEKTKFSFL